MVAGKLQLLTLLDCSTNRKKLRKHIWLGTPGVKLFEGMCPHPDLIIDDWLCFCFIFYNCKSVYHPECSWFLGVDFTKARHSSVFFTNDYSVRHFQVVDWTNFLYLPLSLTLVVTTVVHCSNVLESPGWRAHTCSSPRPRNTLAWNIFEATAHWSLPVNCLKCLLFQSSRMRNHNVGG